MKAAREAWYEGQLDLDPRRLVFIDETGASTKMARLRGRAPRGWPFPNSRRCSGRPRHAPSPSYGPCAGLIYLPPYSPDFNPIEMAFSKLKAVLRKAAARTITELWDTIAEGIDTFTSNECHNYFAAAGYDLD